MRENRHRAKKDFQPLGDWRLGDALGRKQSGEVRQRKPERGKKNVGGKIFSAVCMREPSPDNRAESYSRNPDARPTNQGRRESPDPDSEELRQKIEEQQKKISRAVKRNS
jgi:hypothetical protein